MSARRDVLAALVEAAIEAAAHDLHERGEAFRLDFDMAGTPCSAAIGKVNGGERYLTIAAGLADPEAHRPGCAYFTPPECAAFVHTFYDVERDQHSRPFGHVSQAFKATHLASLGDAQP